MITAGIIAEYNPFHSGHMFHINKTKEQADAVICVMSGAFTQRGAPGIIDKWARAKSAVLCGANLVLELPYPFSAAPAEIFAFGGVSLLERLGCVDFLSFGSESGKIEDLKKAAKLLENNEGEIWKHIREDAGGGKSFAASVAEQTGEYANLFESPNNLLAIKYLNALSRLESGIKPITIKREGDYNGTEIEGKFVSAAAIRKAVSEENLSAVKKYMPQKAYDVFEKEYNDGNIYKIEKLDTFFTAILRFEGSLLSNRAYISEGLENRFIAAAGKYSTVNDILKYVKTKRYTYTRLSRAMLSILLKTDKETVAEHSKKGAAYAKVLAADDIGLELLKKIKKNFPVISCGADYKKAGDYAKKQFELEMRAQDIASLCCENISKRICARDMTEKPYILN